jgi:hypothetical protein
MKTLIFTNKRSVSELPPAIATWVKTASLEPHIINAEDAIGIIKFLGIYEPRVIIIDGYFNSMDKMILDVLSGLPSGDARLEVVNTERLPKSVQILQKVNILADNCHIVFLMDKPSDEVVRILKRMGANIVFRSLYTLSETEQSLHGLIQHGKGLLEAFGKKAREFVDTKK